MKKIINIFVAVFFIMTCSSICYGATGDNLLKSLQVNQEGLSPEFAPEQFNYSLFVKDSISSINVNAIANNEDASIEIIGNDNLKNGDNEVIISVTPKNGDKKEYKILVTKTSNVEASDSYLQNLILENITLQPSFMPEILEYDGGSVPNKINNILTFASARQDGAKVEITGNDNLKDGENIISIKVTSSDNSTSKEYKIKINKEKKENAITDVVEQAGSTDVVNNNSEKVDYRIFIAIIAVLIVVIVVLLIKNSKLKK